jgi:intracellular sulfur oxidation DsrE/DsrF family protein
MRKLRYIASIVTVGAVALLVATSVAAAADAEQSLAKTSPAAAGKPTKGAKSTTAAQTQKQSASVLAAQAAIDKKPHRLILQVNTNDAAAMNLALNNAMNVTEYYKETGEKVEIEVITFGPGLHMLRDDTSPVKARIETMALSTPEVSFMACGNTQANMYKAENKDIKLIPQAQVVPSGVVRVMQLEEQGWSYVKP